MFEDIWKAADISSSNTEEKCHGIVLFFKYFQLHFGGEDLWGRLGYGLVVLLSEQLNFQLSVIAAIPVSFDSKISWNSL